MPPKKENEIEMVELQPMPEDPISSHQHTGTDAPRISFKNINDFGKNISGRVTLSGGSIDVSQRSITANSKIYLTPQDNNTTGTLRVSARAVGTSFVITSSNVLDSGVVAWLLIEP